jgi:uncharacterized repeat protein (TIGR03803 family)
MVVAAAGCLMSCSPQRAREQGAAVARRSRATSNPLGAGGPLVSTVLHAFPCATDGHLPIGTLVQASDGNLYGTTAQGGRQCVGTVFQISKDAAGAYTVASVLHSFGDPGDGSNANAGLIQGTDGNLYGTTLAGGAFGLGAVFQLAKDASGAYTAYSLLHSFTFADGAAPYAALLQASDGNLYGTTYQGGVAGFGTVFQLAKDASGRYTALTRLHSFTSGPGDGAYPSAALIQASDGNLYGTTQNGGSLSMGTVFQLAKDAAGAYTALSLLHSFASGDGAGPNAPLIEASDGNLYGTTVGGGSLGLGTAFQLSKDASGAYTAFSLLHSFASGPGDGAYPYAGLMQGRDGNLYGTAFQGGSSGSGAVFQLSKDASGAYTAFSVLHAFSSGPSGGGAPETRLLEASDGSLYGLTAGGGPANAGTIFQLSKDAAGAYTVLSPLYSFGLSPGEGKGPLALTQASDGNLYGTTSQGGTLGLGSVFRLAKDAGGAYTVFSLLHSFTSAASDGTTPQAPLIEASDGNLYGTTAAGGALGQGTAFQLSRDATGAYTVLTVLHSFSTNEGIFPYAPLLQASDGNLYGTTHQGGALGYGTIFQLAKDAGGAYTVFSVLHSFLSPLDGAYPTAPLIEATDGNLYGTAAQGNTTGYGTVYQLTKDAGGAYTVFTVLHAFVSGLSDGGNPYPGLIQASDGSLYGTTSQGGSFGYGTAFQLSKDATGAYSTFSILHSFSYAVGDTRYPLAPLVQASDGNLYGTTWSAGTNGGGTVFRLSRDTGGAFTAFSVMHAFPSSPNDGASPQAGVLQASDGNLYGTTPVGGTYGSGTVYSLAPQLAVTVTLAGNGSGSVAADHPGFTCTGATSGSTCSGTYLNGAVVALTATPAVGSVFGGWTGACTGTGTCAVTVDPVSAVTATFTLQRFTVTAATTGTGTGTVTCNGAPCGTYDYGTPVTVAATADASSILTSLSGTGSAASCTASGCQLTVTSAAAVTATFTLNRFAVTAATAGTGTGTLTCNGAACGTYYSGTLVTVVATAGAGSILTSLSGTGSAAACTSSGCQFAVTSPATLTATYTLTALRVTPAALAFGNQLVGTTSAAQTVTLSNAGATALAIGPFTASAPFSARTACTTSLAAGTSCTIRVRFAPTTAGPVSGTLTIPTNDPGGTRTVALGGTGIAPVAILAPASLAFVAPLNVASAAQRVTVSNTGTAPLTITSIRLGGANPGQFALGTAQPGGCGTGATGALAAGASCTIDVTFVPTRAAPLAKTATVAVNVAAPATSQAVALTGNIVVPTFTMAPSSLGFGNQARNTASPPQAVTVQNTSPAPLTGIRIGFGGANPGQFTQTNDCGTTLAAGASCTIQVTFQPTSVGAKTANLRVSVAAPGTSQSIPVSGTGT